MKEMPTHFELFDLVHYSHKKLFDNITNTWDVLDKLTDYFNHFTLGSIQGTVSSRAYLINPDQISIGIGSIVEPGAYIKGPCIIGNYCTVRHGAYIRGGVITGDHCVIGHST
jgi:UDP-N-acetylglucosamine diphosphorylase / glucose-1-phosphate thymidylyltransferase / UDP-N-acetylgalactosamine diphosphorylase / glucosamine-1-phosphate N-acetyltransferase / galactosamine-1-phosphate N-acetyltransferase